MMVICCCCLSFFSLHSSSFSLHLCVIWMVGAVAVVCSMLLCWKMMKRKVEKAKKRGEKKRAKWTSKYVLKQIHVYDVDDAWKMKILSTWCITWHQKSFLLFFSHLFSGIYLIRTSWVLCWELHIKIYDTNTYNKYVVLFKFRIEIDRMKKKPTSKGKQKKK